MRLHSKIPAFMRCAFGNLKEHRQKTIILGTMIIIGVFIIVLGYGFLESAKRGVENDFRNHYTGDIVITGPVKKGEVTLFGIQGSVTVGMPPAIPPLPDAQVVLDAVSPNSEVASFGSLISNSYVRVSLENPPLEWDEEKANEENSAYDLMVFSFAGSDAYYSMFTDMKLIEGDFPREGYKEGLFDKRVKESFEKYYGIPLNVGDKILLTAMGMDMRIREVSVCGFYTQPDEFTSMGNLVYLDSTTARGLADLTLGMMSESELPENIDLDVGNLGEDDLFGSAFDDSDMFDSNDTLLTGSFDEKALDDLLGDTSLRDKLNEVDTGAWQFVVIKLKNPSKADKVIKELNETFREKDINVEAINWKTAAGRFSATTDMLEILFTILIVILAIVVFIVIMNTLIVSILERTAEIGTMRALGARRPFIRKMFFTETVTVALLSSLLGVLLALIVAAIVNALGITIDNETARMFLGGGRFKLLPQFNSIATSVLAIVCGTVLANLYPVAVALRITPLKAMNENQ